ncbi:MAG: hypothetical protein MUO37_04875 [Methyloceanibacter sp.]|nr:hypothetical protein [Methyloceanibacter sp.]
MSGLGEFIGRRRKPRFEAQRLVSGQIVQVSGQYTNSSTHKQSTCTKGEKCPPGLRGSHFDLTDPSRHKTDD